jgi:hypothetical protein
MAVDKDDDGVPGAFERLFLGEEARQRRLEP